ncbi:DUF445 domain-containing protein [Heliobacterium chlorum]|uniref:DUF445 domain-containing protein n=1 Tax=Heliobacterium chlorum TaxID=2698 RepID=A0ABR7T1S6_HELCL|nr:DUF445 domain-containing protein [Heliobacterium chlorum]MBC9783596.1 DUF445 domain-containing protein [Heliobacterium chlorum]
MRWKKADIILAASAALFALFVLLRYVYPHAFWIRFGFFTAEAALVGGIADWFAITALFRRPLGFSWHTELIPRNREKTIEAIVKVVEKDLLSAEVLKNRLAHVHLVDGIIDWVEKRRGLSYFVSILHQLLREGMLSLEPKVLARYLERPLKEELRKVSLTGQLIPLLHGALEQGEVDRWLDDVLDELIRIAEKPETRKEIYRLVRNTEKSQVEGLLPALVLTTALLTNSYNPSAAANSMHRQLIDTLWDLKNVDHPLRRKIKVLIAEKLDDVAVRSDWVEALEHWKLQFIDRMRLEDLIRQLMALLNDEQSEEESTSSSWLQGPVERLWLFFKSKRELQDQLESQIKDTLCSIIEREHKLVGQIVYEVLRSFTNDDLNRFIEEKAGNDLQWIRINGSVVGSLVGAMLFLLLEFVYQPLIVPLIRSW